MLIAGLRHSNLGRFCIFLKFRMRRFNQGTVQPREKKSKISKTTNFPNSEIRKASEGASPGLTAREHNCHRILVTSRLLWHCHHHQPVSKRMPSVCGFPRMLGKRYDTIRRSDKCSGTLKTVLKTYRSERRY